MTDAGEMLRQVLSDKSRNLEVNFHQFTFSDRVKIAWMILRGRVIVFHPGKEKKIGNLPT